MALAQTPPAEAKHWLKDVPKVRPGSDEHANLLAAGYGMTVEEAREIIAVREKNPAAYSIAEVRKAQALVQAIAAKPAISSARPMWKRPLAG